MSEDFDPYYKWLGIPPGEQPPNYYRLLGLELFEADWAVIDEAVYRLTSYLTEFRDGDHRHAAAQLIGELAAARDCLLDPLSKALYDDALDAELHADVPSHSTPPRPAPPVLDKSSKIASHFGSTSDQPPIPVIASARDVRSGKLVGVASKAMVVRGHSKRKTTNFSILIGGICFLALVATILVTVLWRIASNRDIEITAPPQSLANSDASPRLQQPAKQVIEERDGNASAADDNKDTESDSLTANLEAETSIEAADDQWSEDFAAVTADESIEQPRDSVEMQVRDGLVLWLNAAKRDSLQLDDIGRVVTWNDLSGNHHHATQPSAGNRPNYFIVNNGRSVVEFGGEHSLAVSNEAAFDLGDRYSFIIVARGNEGVLADKGDGYQSGAFSFWNGVATFRTHNRMLKAADDAAAELKVRSVIADEISLRWFVGGAACGTYSHPHTIDNDQPLLIGCRWAPRDRRYFVGELAELLVYDRALSEEERTNVETYLSAKWLSNPSTRVIDGIEREDPSIAHAPSDDRAADPASPRVVSMPARTGNILREVWRECRGTTVDELLARIKEQAKPDETDVLDKFEAPEDFADQYGQRIRGYLHAPISGVYSFSIKANAEGALFISTDETPENKRRVETSQRIQLTAGNVYYIEGLHKESTGRDNFSIGWKLPDGSAENPIPGHRLSMEPRFIPPHDTGFITLRPVTAKSSSGTTLQLLDDGSVLAVGSGAEGEVYRIECESEIPLITAIRLEALPHESLPGKGPGLGSSGRFSIAEIKIATSSKGEDASWKDTGLLKALGDDKTTDRTIDGDAETKWTARRRGGLSYVTLIPKEPIGSDGAKLLALQLVNGEPMGCFRLLATSATEPENLAPPSANLFKENDEESYSLFVNLGGERYKDSEGTIWLASKDFDGNGFGHEGGSSVTADDVDDPLSGTAVRGILAFRAVVPNGNYHVKLYFCEHWSRSAASRVFSIVAERRPVLVDFDLLRAAGGPEQPFVYPVKNVTVKDGRLDMELRPSRPGASTILNAVSIQKVR